MKDCLGKELNVGDEVIYTGSLGKCLCHGSIKRFAGTMADIYSHSPYQETERRESHKIFKVENKQAILDEIYQWIEDNAYEYVITKGIGIDIYVKFDSERMIADLKKIMEDRI